MVATGTAPLSYQWLKGTANITGATGATLALNGDDGRCGQLHVRVSNSAGNVTSSGGDPDGQSRQWWRRAITTQPASQTVTAGANVSFYGGGDGHSAVELSMDEGAANITGATSATLALDAVYHAPNAGSYTCG